jgi:signal transduction histidine kinase
MFVLLSSLVVSVAFYRITLQSARGRITSQTRLIANEVSLQPERLPSGSGIRLKSAFNHSDLTDDTTIFLFDSEGKILDVFSPRFEISQIDPGILHQLIQGGSATSVIAESTSTKEEILLGYAPVPGTDYHVVLSEPWSAILAPGWNYQVIIAGMLILGATFTLLLLAVSIGRIVKPITDLASNAMDAVPGSIFRPVPERGPKEIRALIIEFNQMVIRLAEQQNLTRQFAEKAMLSQEAERQRISHELHDGTLQDLVGLSQRVELCKNELGRSPELAGKRLDELHSLLGKAINDVRRISNALRPPILEDFGLPLALESLCRDFQADKPDIRCDLSVSGKERRLQPELELAIYRVAQEALVNIRKHVQDASFVQVELLYFDTEIQVKVRNNGTKFDNHDLPSLVRSGHLGLAGMYERARLFNGNLSIETDETQSTLLTLTVPSADQPEKTR